MEAIFKIDKWTSWVAKSATDAPQLPEVSPMQRRRYSLLSKMALRVALDLLPEPGQIRSVFASRHGELHRTVDLLADINELSPLSPTKFSQSVYNTASGLYSIKQNNTAPSTVVTSAKDTLAMAFVEAYSQSVVHQQTVLLVYVDQPLPELYQSYADEPEETLAFACLLTAAEQGWSMHFESKQAASKASKHIANQLISALDNPCEQFVCDMGTQNWIWRGTNESNR